MPNENILINVVKTELNKKHQYYWFQIDGKTHNWNLFRVYEYDLQKDLGQSLLIDRRFSFHSCGSLRNPFY